MLVFDGLRVRSNAFSSNVSFFLVRILGRSGCLVSLDVRSLSLFATIGIYPLFLSLFGKSITICQYPTT
jgi:hypothetical protein